MKHILVTDELEVFNFEYNLPSDSEIITVYPSAIKTIKILKKEYKEELDKIYAVQKVIRRHVQSHVEKLTYVDFAQDLAVVECTDTARQLFLEERITYFDKILRRVNIKDSRNLIEDIKGIPISDFLDFNRAGFAPCLWHNEKTASLKYYPKNNKVYCFGCQKSADVIDVFAQLNGISVADAIRRLKK